MASNEIETDAERIKDEPTTWDFDRYKDLMDYQLKKDNFEILIVSHEDDDKMARKLKSLLMEKVEYYKRNAKVRPKVELHRDLIYEDESPTPELDYSLQKTLVVFLLATASFFEDHWTIFEGRVSLDSVFKKDGKEKFFFVVHTKPKGRIDYRLPLTMESAKHFYFSENDNENDRFYTNVKSVLESKVSFQIKKENELREQRKQFLLKNYPNIFEQFRQSDGRSFLSQATGVQESIRGQHDGQVSVVTSSSKARYPVQNAYTSISQESRDVEVDSSPTLAKQVASDVEVESNPTLVKQVASDVEVDLNPTLVKQVASDEEVDSNPTLVKQVASDVEVDSNPTLVKQVASDVEVDSNPTLVKQVASDVEVDSNPTLVKQVASDVEVDSNPTLVKQVASDVEVDSNPTLVKQVASDIEVDAGCADVETTTTACLSTCDRGIPEGEEGKATDIHQTTRLIPTDSSNPLTFSEQRVQGENKDLEADTTYNTNFAKMNISTASAHVNSKASNHVEPASDSGFNSDGSFRSS
ncbi:hypothetical protein Btru_066980 [Bulinus truncatus]|nr:hypothetical protein Btru_066980 [Bulinus truncatus]